MLFVTIFVTLALLLCMGVAYLYHRLHQNRRLQKKLEGVSFLLAFALVAVLSFDAQHGVLPVFFCDDNMTLVTGFLALALVYISTMK